MSIKTIIWIVGNLVLGILGFYVCLWSLFQAWGAAGSFWLYLTGAVAVVIIVFLTFNAFMIKDEKARKWGWAVLMLLGSTGVTLLVHGILQNTVLE